MATTKDRIHQLVEQLPDNELAAVERVLDDPVLRALLVAPADEEPLTHHEIAGILEARQDVAVGRTRRFTSVEDLISELNADETA